jgi:hypothetical protein
MKAERRMIRSTKQVASIVNERALPPPGIATFGLRPPIMTADGSYRRDRFRHRAAGWRLRPVPG